MGIVLCAEPVLISGILIQRNSITSALSASKQSIKSYNAEFKKVFYWAEDSKDLGELAYGRQKFPVGYSKAQEALYSTVVSNLKNEARTFAQNQRKRCGFSIWKGLTGEI